MAAGGAGRPDNALIIPIFTPAMQSALTRDAFRLDSPWPYSENRIGFASI
jgi:hypothetical protein